MAMHTNNYNKVLITLLAKSHDPPDVPAGPGIFSNLDLQA